MDQHDYVRHTLDCLEEAQVALRLAQRKGQIAPKDESRLVRDIDSLTRQVDRAGNPLQRPA